MEKMGFPEMYAVAALRQTDNDINASMDAIQENPGKRNLYKRYLFEHLLSPLNHKFLARARTV